MFAMVARTWAAMGHNWDYSGRSRGPDSQGRACMSIAAPAYLPNRPHPPSTSQLGMSPAIPLFFNSIQVHPSLKASEHGHTWIHVWRPSWLGRGAPTRLYIAESASARWENLAMLGQRVEIGATWWLRIEGLDVFRRSAPRICYRCHTGC